MEWVLLPIAEGVLHDARGEPKADAETICQLLQVLIGDSEPPESTSSSKWSGSPDQMAGSRLGFNQLQVGEHGEEVEDPGPSESVQWPEAFEEHFEALLRRIRFDVE